jgi:long-chain acyl-CoA synthetase
MTEAGEINAFQPGVGMMASRLNIKVVPVRITGLDHVLHRTARFPTPGRVTVRFGPAIELHGTDYAANAKTVEEAVKKLES